MIFEYLSHSRKWEFQVFFSGKYLDLSFKTHVILHSKEGESFWLGFFNFARYLLSCALSKSRWFHSPLLIMYDFYKPCFSSISSFFHLDIPCSMWTSRSFWSSLSTWTGCVCVHCSISCLFRTSSSSTLDSEWYRYSRRLSEEPTLSKFILLHFYCPKTNLYW